MLVGAHLNAGLLGIVGLRCELSRWILYRRMNRCGVGPNLLPSVP